MALAFPLIIGLALSPFLGGNLRRLGDIRLRAMPLLYAGLGLQLIAFPVHAMPLQPSDRAAVGLWLASYTLLAAATAANIRLPGVPFVALGLVANLAAIIANGGHMPVFPAAMHAAGHSYHVHYNSASIVGPHLSWLVDRWAAPQWIPYANVYSVGDVFIALGGLLFPLGTTGVLRRSERLTKWLRGPGSPLIKNDGDRAARN